MAVDGDPGSIVCPGRTTPPLRPGVLPDRPPTQLVPTPTLQNWRTASLETGGIFNVSNA